jgi:uncharacterized membrane protein YgdD (TMEM256/DUF423 family)
MLGAAIMGMLAVMIGAFGSHVIKPHIDATHLDIYETANRYHFYHTLALMGVAILYRDIKSKWMQWSGMMFIIGICIFSISLYLFAILGDQYKFLGAITPIGGLSLIAGWTSLLVAVLSRKDA